VSRLVNKKLQFAGHAKATRVYSGDTLKIRGHDRDGHYIEMKVRLVGIDAPEPSRSKNVADYFSQKSKKHLASMVLNRTRECGLLVIIM
jgi:endonuclease YncB( thermonuclease family)